MAEKFNIKKIVGEKLTTNLVTLGVVSIIGVFVYRKFFKRTTDVQNEQQEKDEIQKELDPTKLTYPKSNYYQMAQTIQVAGFDVGTDEEAIYSVFKRLKNNADFLALRQAWGKKKIYDWGIPYIMTLAQFLRWELDAKECGNINSILNSKGIKYSI